MSVGCLEIFNNDVGNARASYCANEQMSSTWLGSTLTRLSENSSAKTLLGQERNLKKLFLTLTLMGS